MKSEAVGEVVAVGAAAAGIGAIVVPGAVDRLGVAVGARQRHVAREDAAADLPGRPRVAAGSSTRARSSRAEPTPARPISPGCDALPQTIAGVPICIRHASTTVLGGLSCPEQRAERTRKRRKVRADARVRDLPSSQLLACLAARRERHPAKERPQCQGKARTKIAGRSTAGRRPRAAGAGRAAVLPQCTRKAAPVVDRGGRGLYHRM